MKKLVICCLLLSLLAGLGTMAIATTGESGTALKTYENLLYANQGEVNANAKYKAYAQVAEEEGYAGVSQLFNIIAEAELGHAIEEYAVAKSLGAREMAQPDEVKTGTTIENLEAAIAGETEEFTNMYPPFIETAFEEEVYDARGIFTRANSAEEIHAGVYTDLLTNLDNFDTEKYAVVYRCPVCGNILTSRPENCPVCGDAGEDLIEYQLAL